MSSSLPPPDESVLLNRTIEIGLRIGLLLVLLYWSLLILQPFISPIAWGVVLAIATQPLFRRLRDALGGRSGAAAGVLVAVGLLILIGPVVALTASTVETAAGLSDELREGRLAVPPPPPRVEDWPFIGDDLYPLWSEANQNLENALQRVEPQLRAIGAWLLSTAATTGVGLLKFAVSIVIAGVLLSNGPEAASAADRIAVRLAGARGARLTLLAAATVQSVTLGILGVAALQALLAGIGLLVAGVPAAGLWALLVLLLAVVQLPALIVVLPILVYYFSTHDVTALGVVFAVYMVLVSVSDGPLKALLMGRGVDVPMLVVFMGAIGGFILQGIIGLFVGAVVLAFAYKMATTWLGEIEAAEASA